MPLWLGGDPDTARTQLEAVIAALTDALEELPASGQHEDTTTLVRTRVGSPTFREPRVLNRAAG